MLRLFPISLLFLVVILLRLGYVHGLFTPSSTATAQPLAPPRAPALGNSNPTPRTIAASRPAPPPTGSQARSDAAVVTEP